MDDMDGRAAARRLGIPTIFTVAILELAAEKNLVELPVAIAKLQANVLFYFKGDSRCCIGKRQTTTRTAKVIGVAF
jgi:hypothetical protein